MHATQFHGGEVILRKRLDERLNHGSIHPLRRQDGFAYKQTSTRSIKNAAQRGHRQESRASRRTRKNRGMLKPSLLIAQNENRFTRGVTRAFQHPLGTCARATEGEHDGLLAQQVGDLLDFLVRWREPSHGVSVSGGGRYTSWVMQRQFVLFTIPCFLLCALAASMVAAARQDSGPIGAPKPPPPAVPQPAEPLPTERERTLSPEAAPGQWQLEFTPGDLRVYTDPQTNQHFWYLTYKVVNRTGQERWWAPKFELLEDHGRVRRSGQNVDPIIMKRVEALIGNRLIVDQYQVLGEIKQGEEHAKEGFVVWSEDDLRATELHVFIRGMSSEMQKVETKDGVVMMYKTLKLDYRVPGDAADRGGEPVPCEQREWVLR